MARIDKLFLVTLTRNRDDAGTDAGSLNLTINIEGEDIADMDFGFLGGSGFLSGGLGPDEGWLDDDQAAIAGGSDVSPGEPLLNPFDSNQLTNSSIRVGIRSDDAWSPEHVLILGNTDRRVLALAMETDIDQWLSRDRSDASNPFAKLTMPLRLVGSGTSSTIIRRVLLLIYTGSGSDVDSEDDIELRITAGGNLITQQFIATHDNLKEYTANWFFVDVLPFTRGDVLSNGEIRLRILGEDAWVPKSLFVFGLDTESGRPNEVVHLVSIPKWELGALSEDTEEGQPSVKLPVV